MKKVKVGDKNTTSAKFVKTPKRAAQEGMAKSKTKAKAKEYMKKK